MKGKVKMEEKREWDAKHPDRAAAQYGKDKTIIEEDGSTTTLSAEEFQKKMDADYEATVAAIDAKKGGK